MAGSARGRGRSHRNDAVRGVSQHHARMLSPEAGVSFGVLFGKSGSVAFGSIYELWKDVPSPEVLVKLSVSVRSTIARFSEI